MAESINLPPHPAPLTWAVAPVAWEIIQDTLSVTAGPKSDMFISPQGEPAVLNAARLLGPISGDFQLSACVHVDFAGTFDAGALLVWQDATTWAKLCFEYSPDTEPMVVSVVTRGVSDDANGFIVHGKQVWLRISRMGQALAFHASIDGQQWALIRHFGLALGDAPLVGFVAQAPIGAGCAVRFEHISAAATRLRDIRSGE